MRKKGEALKKKYPLPFEAIGFRIVGKGGRVVRWEKFDIPITVTAADTLKVFWNAGATEARITMIRDEIKAVEAAVRNDLASLRRDLLDLGHLRQAPKKRLSGGR